MGWLLSPPDKRQAKRFHLEATVAALCPHCRQPIGYDKKYYILGADSYSHALCEWQQANRRALGPDRR